MARRDVVLEELGNAVVDPNVLLLDLLHALVQTYSSCVEYPIQWLLYLAIRANLDLKIYGGDDKDAFAHSPLPSVPTFVTIDEQYIPIGTNSILVDRSTKPKSSQ